MDIVHGKRNIVSELLFLFLILLLKTNFGPLNESVWVLLTRLHWFSERSRFGPLNKVVWVDRLGSFNDTALVLLTRLFGFFLRDRIGSLYGFFMRSHWFSY